MKILVICQHYDPEPFRIGDICAGLKARGHEVLVVTGRPNYPMGKIYDGYEKGKRDEEKISGVDVHRCPVIERRTDAIHRLLNYYSFPITSKKYVDTLAEDFDVVFVYQLSPVMMAEAGIRYKKRYNKKLVLYCLDLWPESLLTGGISKDSAIYRLFHRKSKKIYQQVDRILISSKAFEPYFEEEFGRQDVGYLPQYSESLFQPEHCRKQSGNTIDLMFAGNIGMAQDMDTIIGAAEKTKDVSNLYWHILGDGIDLERIKERAKDLPNVIFYGRKPLEEMPKYYKKADAMLVTLADSVSLNRTLPGKVQSYMAAGKAIIGAISGEGERVISEAKCGYTVKPGDAESLARCVLDFCEDENKAVYGENAQKYYQANFEKSIFLDRLIEEIEKVCAQ